MPALVYDFFFFLGGGGAGFFPCASKLQQGLAVSFRSQPRRKYQECGSFSTLFSLISYILDCTLTLLNHLVSRIDILNQHNDDVNSSCILFSSFQIQVNHRLLNEIIADICLKKSKGT